MSAVEKMGYADMVPLAAPDFMGVEADLDGAASTLAVIPVVVDSLLVGWEYVVTEAVVATTTEPVLSIETADADGTTSATEQATATIADATAVGAVGPATKVFNYGNGLKVAAGKAVVLKHKTQGAGGTTSGKATVKAWIRPAAA